MHADAETGRRRQTDLQLRAGRRGCGGQLRDVRLVRKFLIYRWQRVEEGFGIGASFEARQQIRAEVNPIARQRDEVVLDPDDAGLLFT